MKVPILSILSKATGGNYVATVLDMGSDLHAVTKMTDRGRGYVSGCAQPGDPA